MPHSFSQTASLTCPQCGQTFSAEIWLIVDAEERPDLAERIRAGTLHALTCPHCGYQGQVDAPLLVYTPSPSQGEGRGGGAEQAHGRAPLLFSPAQRTTAEEDREQAASLVGLLRERMGPAWRDEWLARGLPGVPRPLLPAALSDDPEAALRQMAEQVQREIERLQQEDPETYRQLEAAARRAAEIAPLLQTLQNFIQADTWDDSRRIVEAHPELLSDEADALLGQLVQAAQAQGDEDARRILEEHRALLRRCREAGIARAFAEKMLPPEVLAQAEEAGLSPEQALEMTRLAAQMPPELVEVLAKLAAGGAEIRSPEDLERLLAARPDLREKLEQVVAALTPPPVSYTHLTLPTIYSV